MDHLGANESLQVFDALERAYSEPHRAYHTAEHIDDCLSMLDEVYDLARDSNEIELALWFHDAIYSVKGGGNERKSAKAAVDFLRGIGVSSEFATNVNRHILATEHKLAPTDPDSALVVDIDLSILGTDADTYEAFETNVRKEYSWVPDAMYNQKRKTILSGFMRRDSIYKTEHFRGTHEAQARKNLTKVINRL